MPACMHVHLCTVCSVQSSGVYHLSKYIVCLQCKFAMYFHARIQESRWQGGQKSPQRAPCSLREMRAVAGKEPSRPAGGWDPCMVAIWWVSAASSTCGLASFLMICIGVPRRTWVQHPCRAGS